MRLTSLTLAGFARLADQTIDLDKLGRAILFHGGSASGKTSLCDAIAASLTGAGIGIGSASFARGGEHGAKAELTFELSQQESLKFGAAPLTTAECLFGAKRAPHAALDPEIAPMLLRQWQSAKQLALVVSDGSSTELQDAERALIDYAVGIRRPTETLTPALASFGLALAGVGRSGSDLVPLLRRGAETRTLRELSSGERSLVLVLTIAASAEARFLFLDSVDGGWDAETAARVLEEAERLFRGEQIVATSRHRAGAFGPFKSMSIKEGRVQ